MGVAKTYEQVIDELGDDATLLVGNGFSIACDGRYSYQALKENLQGELPTISLDLMKRLATDNVEQVMQILEDARWVGGHLRSAPDPELDEAHASTRKAMVQAIARDHLRSPKEIDEAVPGRSRSAGEFLSRFGAVFTTNYDLLLYWIMMKNNPKGDSGLYRFQDGFRRQERCDFGELDRKVDVNVFYLHGALHLYTHEGTTRKLIRGANRSLVDLVQDVFEKGGEPLVVAAGRAEQKEEAIRKNDYLSFGFDQLGEIRGDLVIYGLSLGESDRHILESLAKNPGLRRVYLSFHGDPLKSGNIRLRAVARALQERAAELRPESPLGVELFHSESARVWG